MEVPPISRKHSVRLHSGSNLRQSRGRISLCFLKRSIYSTEETPPLRSMNLPLKTGGRQPRLSAKQPRGPTFPSSCPSWCMKTESSPIAFTFFHGMELRLGFIRSASRHRANNSLESNQVTPAPSAGKVCRSVEQSASTSITPSSSSILRSNLEPISL